jgi:hypothetical protein
MSDKTDLAPFGIDRATGDVLSELTERFFDIPFENSDYQNKAFVLAAALTPGRAYRAIGLRMHSKIEALKEYQHNREMSQIDVEEKEAKIADPNTSEFDRRRLRLEIRKILDGCAWGDKLKNDALKDLNSMYRELQKFPRYTRETFEAEEKAHFTVRLNRQLTANGAQESLANMKDLENLDHLLLMANEHFAKLEHKE